MMLKVFGIMAMRRAAGFNPTSHECADASRVHLAKRQGVRTRAAQLSSLISGALSVHLDILADHLLVLKQLTAM
jgi:hypothetical protein